MCTWGHKKALGRQSFDEVLYFPLLPLSVARRPNDELAKRRKFLNFPPPMSIVHVKPGRSHHRLGLARATNRKDGTLSMENVCQHSLHR
jgi:hypothetical protein